jgi:TetR/AcrR family transcriptional regulator
VTTREKILASARNEFSDKGFEGSRVDRIARGAGVNKAMIYYHFESKEALYRAVFDDLVTRLREVIRSAVEEELDLEGLIRQMAEQYVALFESSRQFAPLVLRELASGGERIRGVVAGMLSEIGAPQRIRELFGEGIRNGTYRQIDVVHASVSFIGMNLFYLFFSPVLNSIWEITDDEAFRRLRPEAVVDLFLNGVRSG